MTQELTSIYKGGNTADAVREEIRKRFGDIEAEEYDPRQNCFTFKGWRQRGYIVKRGEKGIRSITIIEEEKDGEKVRFTKTVWLFAKCQVEEIED